MGFKRCVVALTLLLCHFYFADGTPKIKIEPAIMDHSFTNLLSYEWQTFALLDNSEINPTNKIGCHTKELPLPANWQLASSTDITHRAAMMMGGTWGTSCVVFGDGVSLNTRGEVCGIDQLVKKNDTFTVKQCDQKILVVQKVKDHFIQEFSKGSVVINETVSSWGKETVDKEEKDVLTMASEGNSTVARIAYRVSSVDNHLSWEGFTLTFQCKTNSTTPVPLKVSARILYTIVKQTPDTVKEFNCTSDWSAFSVDIYAQTDRPTRGPPSYVSLYDVFFLLNTSGVVQISDVGARPLPGNLLVNPSFDSTSPISIRGWSYLAHEKGSPKASFMPSADSRSEKETNSPWGSVLVFNGFRSFDGGISQEISLQDKHFRQAIYVGGWSKAMNVLGSPDDNYCIWVEVTDKSGVTTNVLTLPFSTGTHDWEYKDGVIHLPRDRQLVSLRIIGLFRNHVGIALFDDFVVKLGLPTQNHYNCFGGAFGDPHMITFDGDYYSFQFPGEFVLFTSERFEVQSRHEYVSPLAASITGVAVRFGNQSFSIIAVNGTDQPRIYHNKARITSLDSEANGFLSFPSSGSVISRGSLKRSPNQMSYTITIQSHLQLMIDIYEGRGGRRQPLHLRASLPTTDVGGLLGSCQNPHLSWRTKIDNSSEDSLNVTQSSYDMLAANYSMYSKENMTNFASSWLVTTQESLFNYEHGENPEFFRDISVKPAESGDVLVKESDIKIAASMCKTQHLKPALTNACEIDLLFKNLTLVDYHKFMFMTKGGSPSLESSTLDPGLNQKNNESDQQFYKMMVIGLVVVFIFVGIAVFFIVLMSQVRKRRRNYQMVALDSESGGDLPSSKTT